MRTLVRQSRASRNNSRKPAGVSLMAAARPISTPRGHLGLDASTSTATKAMSTKLIWPKLMVSRTGSSWSATATATAVTTQDVRFSRSGRTRPSTMRTVTTSAATDTAVNTNLASVTGISASGTKRIAASGG